jgi:hypothetical protein
MKACLRTLGLMAALGAVPIHAEGAGDDGVRRQAGMWAASIGPLVTEPYDWDLQKFLPDEWEASPLAHPRLHYYLSPRLSLGGELYIEWEFHMTILDQFSGLGQSRLGGLILDSRYNLLTSALTPCVSLGLGLNAGSLGQKIQVTSLNSRTSEVKQDTVTTGPSLSLRPGVGLEYLHPSGWFLLIMGVFDHAIIRASIVADKPLPYKIKTTDELALALSIGKAFSF